MERLTGRNEKGELLFDGKQVYAGDFYEAASALEEYEDTGLTPKQVRELQERQDKIAEQLEECKNLQFSSFSKPLIAVEDAIKIVKGGADDA